MPSNEATLLEDGCGGGFVVNACSRLDVNASGKLVPAAALRGLIVGVRPEGIMTSTVVTAEHTIDKATTSVNVSHRLFFGALGFVMLAP